MNVDVEIYYQQITSFFTKNPESLTELIGSVNKDLFYSKLKEQSLNNFEKGDDVALTRQQIIDIVVELRKDEVNKDVRSKVHEIFQKTKFGEICLN
jgi:hypothetical protein